MLEIIEKVENNEKKKVVHVGFIGNLDTTYIVKIEKDGEYHVSEVGL